jgi:hypothetical protein
VPAADVRSTTMSSVAIRSCSVTRTSGKAPFIIRPTCLKPTRPGASVTLKLYLKSGANRVVDPVDVVLVLEYPGELADLFWDDSVSRLKGAVEADGRRR